jgi:hypothetical protein
MICVMREMRAVERKWDAFTETEKRRAVQGLPGVEA